jgi:hypothetical protein
MLVANPKLRSLVEEMMSRGTDWLSALSAPSKAVRRLSLGEGKVANAAGRAKALDCGGGARDHSFASASYSLLHPAGHGQARSEPRGRGGAEAGESHAGALDALQLLHGREADTAPHGFSLLLPAERGAWQSKHRDKLEMRCMTRHCTYLAAKFS